MKLNEILAIAGRPGLFKLIAQGKNNIIVESLVDGTRMPAFTTDKVSSLSDIALFTTGEELPLSEVFMKMYQVYDKKEIIIDFKNQSKEMLEHFAKAVPEYDKTRVYSSDIKKLMTWYNILVKKELLPFEEEKKEETEAKQEQDATSEISTVEETKPEEKTKPIKEKKIEEKKKKSTAAKPVKKTTSKSSTSKTDETKPKKTSTTTAKKKTNTEKK